MDERFFYGVLIAQCWPALVLTAWVGPRLISTDMSNNALAIILSHPITRSEYVLAKLMVMAGFLSAVTWVPLLLLFVFQSHLSAQSWAGSHMGIGIGMFLGSWLWIILLSLMALALASWVKWRIVATGLLFGFVFVPAGVGTVSQRRHAFQLGQCPQHPVHGHDALAALAPCSGTGLPCER